VLGATIATWLGYPNWDQANLQEITQPLDMPDTMSLESFAGSQVARAANHCSPALEALRELPASELASSRQCCRGLFSTARDMLQFLAYNVYGTTGTPPNRRLAGALPIVHKNYEHRQRRQELAWQT